MGIEFGTFSSALRTAAPVMQATGAVLGATSAFSNSKAVKGAAQTNARIQELNAQAAEWQAKDAIARGDRSAGVARLKTRQFKGSQRAAMAANGVDLSYGSALDILNDTDQFGEIDAETIRDNAAREAWALRQQAAGLGVDATMYRARAAGESPMLAASTSLLTSAGRVADRWYSDVKPSLNYEGDGLSQGDRRKIGVS